MTTGTFIARFSESIKVAFVALTLNTLLLGTSLLGAQNTTGTIRGNITAEGGAQATGTTITATNIATGIARSNIATDRGTYVLTGLVPGV